jgi:hypothetical protein
MAAMSEESQGSFVFVGSMNCVSFARVGALQLAANTSTQLCTVCFPGINY